MNDTQFQRILTFIEAETGILLPESAYRTVKEYVTGRTGSTGMTQDELFTLIRSDEEERASFLDSVTINETYFFREERHFAVLETEIFPELKKAGNGRVKMWSAACSSGEEAVSLAVLAAEHFGPRGFTVYAGDINPRTLKRLEEKQYGKNSYREDGKRFHSILSRYLRPQGGIEKDMETNIKVNRLNLSDDKYPHVPDDLDIAFLRNTLIYMMMKTRQTIIDRIAAKLRPGGYLFLSSTEIAHLSHPDLVLVHSGETYYFRKRTLEEKKQGTVPCLEATRDTQTPETPGPRSRDLPAVSVEDVLFHATNRMNNPVYSEENDPSFHAALLCLRAVYYLNTGETERANGAVEEAERKYGKNAVTLYLTGSILLQRERTDRALTAFRRTYEKEPRFWPARIKTALLSREKDPKGSRFQFSRCLRDIETYIETGRYHYQFLLEGFNAKYFASLCEGWLKKL